MLENASSDSGSLSHVPPHGPCGAFGAGQPWASTIRFRDPLDKRGLASGFLRKVWFWGPVHAAPVCFRVGFLFVGVLCVARLKRTKEGSPTQEHSFSEGSRQLSTAWVLSQLVVFGRLAAGFNSVGPFAACRLFRCRPRQWSCVMFHGVRGRRRRDRRRR